jgi:hypothetical protein
MAALGGSLIVPTTDAGDGSDEAQTVPSPDQPRPLIERVGLGLIALVFAVVFGGLSAGAFMSGEVFLGTMAGIGALMTLWAAAGTARR